MQIRFLFLILSYCLVLGVNPLWAQESAGQSVELLLNEKQQLENKVNLLLDERKSLIKKFDDLNQAAQLKPAQDCSNIKPSQKLLLEKQAMLEQLTNIRAQKVKLTIEVEQLRNRLKDKELSFQQELSKAVKMYFSKSLYKDDRSKLVLEDEYAKNLKSVFDEEIQKIKNSYESKEGNYLNQKSNLESMVNDHDDFVENLKEENDQLKSVVNQLTQDNADLKINFKNLKDDTSSKIDLLETNVVNAHAPYKEKVSSLEEKIQKLNDSCQKSIQEEKSPLIEKILDTEDKMKNQIASFKNQSQQLDECKEKNQAIEVSQNLFQNKLSESQDTIKKVNHEFDLKLKEALSASQKDMNQAKTILGSCQENLSKNEINFNSAIGDISKLQDELTQLRNLKLKLEQELVKKENISGQQITVFEQKIKDIEALLKEKDSALNKVMSGNQDLSVQLKQIPILKSDLEKVRSELKESLASCQKQASNNQLEVENKCTKKVDEVVLLSNVQSAQLNQTVESLRQEIKDITLQSDQTNQQRVQEYDQKVKNLQKTVDVKNDENIILKNSYQNSDKQNSELVKQLENFKQENMDFKNALMQKDVLIKTLQSDLKQAESDHTQKITSLMRTLEDKTKTLGSINNDAVKVNEQLSQKSKDLIEVSANFQKIQSELARLNQEKQEMSNSVAALSKNLEQNSSELMLVKNTKETQDKEFLDLKDKTLKSEVQKNELLNKINQLSVENTKLSENSVNIKNEFASFKQNTEVNLKSSKQENDQSLSQLKLKLAQQEKILEEKSDVLLQKTDGLQAAQKQLNFKDGELNQLKDQIGLLNTKVTDLIQQHQGSLTKQKELLENDFKNNIETLKNQSSEQALLNKNQYEQKITELTTKLTDLMRQHQEDLIKQKASIENELKNETASLKEKSDAQALLTKNQYEQKISELTTKLSEKENVLQVSSNHLDQRNIDYQSLEKQIKFKDEENKKFKDQVNSLSSNLAKLNEQSKGNLDNQKSQLDSAIKKTLLIQTQYDESLAQISALVKENNELKQSLSGVKQALILLRDKSSSQSVVAKNEHEKSMAELTAKISNQEKLIQLKSEDVLQKIADMKLLNNQLSVNKEMLSSLNSQMSALNLKYNQLENQHSKDMINQKQQSDEGIKEIVLNKDRANDLAMRLEAKAKENASLTQELDEAKSQILSLNQKNDAQLSGLKKEFEEIKLQMKSKLSDQEVLLNNKTNEVAQQAVDKQGLEKQIDSKREEISKFKSQLSVLNLKLTELGQQYGKDLVALKVKFDDQLNQMQISSKLLADENVNLKQNKKELEDKLNVAFKEKAQFKIDAQDKLTNECFVPKDVMPLQKSIDYLQRKLLETENKLEAMQNEYELLQNESKLAPALNNK